MSTTFLQEGRIVDVVAPRTVASGDGVLVGDLFGIAQIAIASGVSGPIMTEGVHKLAKTSAQAWTQGQPIAWDDTNHRFESDLTKGPMVGVATAAAANPSSTGTVKLNRSHVRRPASIQEGSPAPASDATVGNFTVTAAQLLSGVIVRDPGANATDTLPTAALLVAAVPGAQVGDMIRCLYVNGADAAETITLAAGAGGAFDANQTAGSRIISQNTSKLVQVRLTNVTAASEAYVVYA